MIDMRPHNRTAGMTILVILVLLFGSAFIIRQLNERFVPAETAAEANTSIEIPADWEEYTSEAFGYTISHPADVTVQANGENSITLNPVFGENSGGPANFAYVSIVPESQRSVGDGAIYNYNKVSIEQLLRTEVNGTTDLSSPDPQSPTQSEWYTYTRLPDMEIADETAQVYENKTPWEFPEGTTEFRYMFFKGTDLVIVGGYVQPEGEITKEELEIMIASLTFAERETTTEPEEEAHE